MGQQAEQDLSSFMSVLIMTIGALTILLAANTLIIASNPENLQITSMFRVDAQGDETAVMPKHHNTIKDPTYIDVNPQEITILPERYVVRAGDVDGENNSFSDLLKNIESKRDEEYIILVLRPGSASFSRKLRGIIRSRKIDIGIELMDTAVEFKLSSEVVDEDLAPRPKPAPTEASDTGAAEAEAPPADDADEGAPPDASAPPGEEAAEPEPTSGS